MMLKSVVIALALVVASPAYADWKVTVEALTDLPLQGGVHASVELPGRLRVSTTLGWLPGPYVKLINAVVVAAGGYDESTADLVESALRNALVWRLHAGWRPFSSLGLYVEVGYGVAAMGGGINGEDIVTLATGISPPSTEPTRIRAYDVSSTLHMIDAEVGWRFILWRGLSLRVALGFAGTFASSTSVDPTFPVIFPQVVSAFTKPAEDYLDDVYTSYVFFPTISVGLGWCFDIR